MIRLKKSRKFTLSLVVLSLVGSLFGATAFAADSWDVSGNRTSIDGVTMQWSNTTNPYGIDPSTENVDVYQIGNTYGNHVTSTSSVTNDADYVARTIFAEAINVSPRVDNAFAIAQTINNRMISSGQTAKQIVSNTAVYNGTGTTPWLWPSKDTYDPAFSESGLTQEALYAHCLLLADRLVQNYNIPTLGSYTYIGSRVNFYDISSSVPFYTGSGKTGQCTASNVTSASYYQTYPLKQSIIKIGNHVFYTY